MASNGKIQVGIRTREALEKIDPKLSPEDKTEATNVTTRIIEEIRTSYTQAFNRSDVGAKGKGVVTKNHPPTNPPLGLIYGKIQSGKTRAMILSTALALDNKFRVVIVLTSNLNKLVGQTHEDFTRGLPGVKIYFKTEIKGKSLDREAGHVKESLENDDSFRVVLVCSKGPEVLGQVAKFLDSVGAQKYPGVIFDDEGDQATMDTNTLKRSKKEPKIKPSTIHNLIHGVASSITKSMPYSVFVSVTGTPNGIFLQNSESRVSFVHLLEAGKGYVGGAYFFKESDPNKSISISQIDGDERIRLLEEDVIPHGLKQAICFFVLSAAAVYSSSKEWREYKFLCHPSVKQDDHNDVMNLIGKFVDSVIRAARDPKNSKNKDIINILLEQYDDLKKTALNLPDFNKLLEIVKSTLPNRTLLVLNSNSDDRNKGYDRHYNFIVGGNTVGRGLVIKELLTTYYVREPKTSVMDTMYQHARMFGYREKTIPYTRVFLPPQLYERFHLIYESDEELRKLIKKHPDIKGSPLFRTAPGFGLRPTRKEILDANHVHLLSPGKQIFPKKPIFSKAAAKPMREKVLKELEAIFPGYDKPENKDGIIINVDKATKLLKLIKSRPGGGRWSDKQAPNYLKSICNHLKSDEILLKFRRSPRRKAEFDGLLKQGVLSGKADVKPAANSGLPSLWISIVSGNAEGWDNEDFIFPTIVVPVNVPFFVFNNT